MIDIHVKKKGKVFIPETSESSDHLHSLMADLNMPSQIVSANCVYENELFGLASMAKKIGYRIIENNRPVIN